MTLLEQIKILCGERGETLASLEREMGFGNGTIRRWSNAMPSANKLAKLAIFFHVSVDSLLGQAGLEKSCSTCVSRFICPVKYDVCAGHDKESVFISLLQLSLYGRPQDANKLCAFIKSLQDKSRTVAEE